MDIHITATNTKDVYETMRKKLDLEIVLPPNVEIEDPAWKDPKVPTQYSINLHNQSIYLHFGIDEFIDEKKCKTAVEAYKSHGWKILGETR